MKITKDNLNEVMFENQDARLLIEDVVTHTGASLYYYHDMEITVQRALDIWYKAMGAEEEEDINHTLIFPIGCAWSRFLHNI